MTKQLSIIIVALILSLGLVISTLIFSYFFFKYDSNSSNLKKINAAGYAEKYFHADFSVLTGKLGAKTNVKNFQKYLNKQGISNEEITFTKNDFKIESEFIHKVEEIYISKV